MDTFRPEPSEVAQAQEPDQAPVSPGLARAKQKHDLQLKRAQAAAQRLLEHYPVDDSTGRPPPRPKTSDQLVEYVEWALPRARKLGTRVTAPEARAIGFMHGLYHVRQNLAIEALNEQRAQAARDRDAAVLIVTD